MRPFTHWMLFIFDVYTSCLCFHTLGSAYSIHYMGWTKAWLEATGNPGTTLDSQLQAKLTPHLQLPWLALATLFFPGFMSGCFPAVSGSTHELGRKQVFMQTQGPRLFLEEKYLLLSDHPKLGTANDKAEVVNIFMESVF